MHLAPYFNGNHEERDSTTRPGCFIILDGTAGLIY